MKKVVSIIFVTTIVLFAACKKDPNTVQQPIANRTNTVNNTQATYNIWYRQWYPADSISVPGFSGKTDSLVISLDSTNLYKVTLYASSEYGGYINGGSVSGSYFNNFTSIFSQNSNVLVSCGKGQLYSHPGPTSILNNAGINDSLTWSSSITLRGCVFQVGGVGWWDVTSTPSYNNDYIGIKIISSSGNRYGWIKVSNVICGGGLNCVQCGSYGGVSSLIMNAQVINNNYGQYILAGQTH